MGLNPRRRASSGARERRRRALMTLATCSRASAGKMARISPSPVWCCLTPRIAPDLLKQSWPVGVDGEGELARQRAETLEPRGAVHAVAVPVDLAVPPGDGRKPLSVGLDPEAVGRGQGPELRDSALPL